MSRRVFSDVPAMLHDLLDRFEASPGAARLLAYIDEDGFTSVRDRDRFEQALDSVAATGGIQVQRRRVDGDVLIASVRLADPAPLYAHLARQPASEQTDAALASVRARDDLPEGVEPLIDEIAEAWSRGVRRFGLAPGDTRSLDRSLSLVNALALRAADAPASQLDFRTFSRHAGADSKALDRLSSTVAAIMTRLFPNLISSDQLDANELLATFGVTKMPQPLLISGPLRLGDKTLPDLGYYGFPPEEATRIQLARPVAYVLTIENYVSFVRHVRELNQDRSALIMYTGGFPARAHLGEIERLAVAADEPLFHWGDLDAGGVRIFRHLEDALARHRLVLKSHLMDAWRLREFGEPSRNKIRLNTSISPASDIYELWNAISETGLVLEQETIAPASPLATLL